MARMDQGRRAREGVDGQGTVNNSVIVPEELTAGVIAGGLERGQAALPKRPRRRSASRLPRPGRHVTDFGHPNRDETGVIMTKIREVWSEPPEERDIWGISSRTRVPSADADPGPGRRAPAGGRRRRSGRMVWQPPLGRVKVWQPPVGEGHAWQTSAGGSRCGERPPGSKLAVASLAAAEAAEAGRQVGGG